MLWLSRQSAQLRRLVTSRSLSIIPVGDVLPSLFIVSVDEFSSMLCPTPTQSDSPAGTDALPHSPDQTHDGRTPVRQVLAGSDLHVHSGRSFLGPVQLQSPHDGRTELTAVHVNAS